MADMRYLPIELVRLEKVQSILHTKNILIKLHHIRNFLLHPIKPYSMINNDKRFL